MRNFLQSIVLMLAGVGIYFVIQILFFPQPNQNGSEVADLTRELSDIKQVIARISEEPDTSFSASTSPASISQNTSEPRENVVAVLTPPAPRKAKARPETAQNKIPATNNPFEKDLSKAQLLAAIVRTVKAQADDSIASPPPLQGADVGGGTTTDIAKSNSPRFYTIQTGDSLRSIARKIYGDQSLYVKIYEANKRLLPTVNHIQVGQRLRIPTL